MPKYGPFAMPKTTRRTKEEIEEMKQVDEQLRLKEITEYHVTGVDREGKRFKFVFGSRMHALGINLWQGTVWKVNTETKKRTAIKRVYN